MSTLIPSLRGTDSAAKMAVALQSESDFVVRAKNAKKRPSPL